MSATGRHDPSAAAARPLATQQAVFAVLFALLTAGCWMALWLWSASPYARYLEHPGCGDVTTLAAFCRTVAVPAGGRVLAWVLMIAAMMLPTTYPLLAMFRRITGGRADRGRLLWLVIGGFLLVWCGFGLLAHVLDAGVRAWVVRSDWAVAHGWVLGTLVLGGAGAFQFSALKYRCLEECAAPFGFVASRWHGSAPAAEALRIGIDHGVFCVGCCWALMLVMFVVGTGSLVWMLALAAAMAAEKNLPGGRRLRVPLGLGLLVGAAAQAAL